jgi:hypothetical protein
MQALLARLAPRADATVLDLGGSVGTWEQFPHRFDVTLLNVDEAHARDFRDADAAVSRYRVAIGDACDLGRYEDASFDIVFSNSVIEHIGDASRVARFAREVRRVGRGYWVQTPSWLFPIEAHTGLPFFWLYHRILARGARRSPRPALRDEPLDLPHGPDALFPAERAAGALSGCHRLHGAGGGPGEIVVAVPEIAMHMSTLVQMGGERIVQELREKVYLATGVDTTQPRPSGSC